MPVPRTRHLVLVALVLAVAAGLLGACGDDDDDVATDPGDTTSTTDPTATTTPGEPLAPVVDLTITVGDGTSVRATSTLTCGDDGTATGTGELADPTAAAAACAVLATDAGLEALEPTPDDVACTEIYGGPDTATITGELAGDPVDVTLTRRNGCEIARWDALVALVGEPVGA